ncbi:hypothetical protein [Blastococcus sp. KM273129]|uniref:hypothetical protein n=1 Tax=Blastococcus sp. KM273129 TaxID=2570315 RepID=UPI001F2DE57F|nr:hypothetical protein [Blastococcus sp. KM273129]MCF6736927.1 hypothetical protein [Blastococcus sp. KM273129]
MTVARRALPFRRTRTRRYLNAGVDLDDFFDFLNGQGIRYAVLRWFETLPEVAPGEDIDILVADEDLDLVGAVLTSHRLPPRRQKFDVYSVTGLPGSDYRSIPYFSEPLARAVLERAVLLRDRYRVPSPLDHFDSMAYHAVYHKGDASGLPRSAGAAPLATAGLEHDYLEILGELAEAAGVSVPLTMDDLDAYLTGKGLRPPLDTLDKLSASNDWLRHRIEEQYGPVDGGIPGLSVFVLRERAISMLARLQDELPREGFEPLETVWLDPAAVQRATAAVRGGNWGRGPFAVGGGPPAAYVVAYDLRAALPGAPVGTAGTDDARRVLESKLAIRRRLLAGVPPEHRYNPVHSSDDPRQALDYLAVLRDDDVLDRCRQKIGRIRAETVFPFPVVELLPSHRRRAISAVVVHPEFGECVCKLFYPSAVRFLARELRARTDFAALPEVPAMLASGANWILSPRYTDTGAHVRRRLPGVQHVQLKPQVSLAMAELARALHEKGSFLLDLSPANLLTDRAEGLKVIDWEFLQEFPGEPPGLLRSPTVLGRADDLVDVDTPLGVSTSGSAAVTVFNPMVTGLPRRLLLGAARRSSPIVALAELGMVVGWLRRGVRSAVRDALRGSERVARRSVRRSVAALAQRRTV